MAKYTEAEIDLAFEISRNARYQAHAAEVFSDLDNEALRLALAKSTEELSNG